ncbi:MAG: zinc ribbon domain-containing protein YjdM [Flavobacterium sp.]
MYTAGNNAVSENAYFYRNKNQYRMEVKDSNGTLLSEGDSVTVIKDLKVKGSSSVIKRGTVVKNIRLTGDTKEIEGKVEKTVMVLKTEFLKKQ